MIVKEYFDQNIKTEDIYIGECPPKSAKQQRKLKQHTSTTQLNVAKKV
jgi:hypothetical protein